MTFVAGTALPGPCHRGWLIHDTGQGRAPILCLPDCCEVVSGVSTEFAAASATLLRIIPLERGLFALEANGRFLSAKPGGRIYLETSVCSTWEFFLASEDWCGRTAPATDGETAEIAEASFDRKRIHSYIVHPIIRARTDVKPELSRLLIYGYPQWSHGRVYYDLCKRLYQKGYIVDILNWQGDHAEYFHELTLFYDLYMTAPDGVPYLGG